jgi:hypothetical protein
VISPEDTVRIQEHLGRLALEAVGIDLDGFIEACEQVGSAQALASGINATAVSSAGEWADLARLLKPFRDNAVARLAAIRKTLGELNDDLVAREATCPACGERRTDELGLNDDGSVLCATCGRRYHLPGEEASE